MEYSVTVKPGDIELKVSDEESLLDALQKAVIEIESECGGIGVCGLCMIHVLGGEVSEITLEEEDHLSEEEFENGERLACQTFPRSDSTISIP